jgi:hypothetical protein
LSLLTSPLHLHQLNYHIYYLLVITTSDAAFSFSFFIIIIIIIIIFINIIELAVYGLCNTSAAERKKEAATHRLIAKLDGSLHSHSHSHLCTCTLARDLSLSLLFFLFFLFVIYCKNVFYNY